MWAAIIIVYPPGFDDIRGVFQGEKPVLVQALIPQPADEALGRGVFSASRDTVRAGIDCFSWIPI